jgi:hypothetical protein
MMLIVLACASSADAHERVVGRAHSMNPLLTGCPDDYCPKPVPRIVCLPCGGPDDYCPKVLPRLRCLPGGECDNYCRKPWPHICRPIRSEYYNCGK